MTAPRLRGQVMPGYYALKPSGSQFMFNLKADNRQTILTSERYESKQNAQRGIESRIESCKRNGPSLDEREQA